MKVLMLFRETIFNKSENHMKDIHKLCQQNAEFWDVTESVTQSHHWAVVFYVALELCGYMACEENKVNSSSNESAKVERFVCVRTST
jgi:hypothetical protein